MFTEQKASLPKTCHTRPAMIKLATDVPYLKKIQKIYESRDSIFSLEIRKFCYIKKYRYISNFDTQFLILLTFFESLKIVLINMGIIFMILAKLATLGLIKIKIF